MKKVISILITVVMLIGILPIANLDLKASAASYNASAAVDYAKTYVNYYNSNYNSYKGKGGDCANFVSQCLYAGGLQTDATWKPDSYAWINVWGLYSYLTSKNYSVSYDTASAEEGDVVIYANSSATYGHATICVESGSKVASHTDDGIKNITYMKLTCVIKMNGSTPPCADLGDEFYALIINTKLWKRVTNDANNVSLRSSISQYEPSQIWYFYKHEDNSYSIRSASSGLHLTAADTSSGSNIKVAAWTGSDSQYWWIYGESGKYVIKPKSSNCCMTVKNGSSDEGTNIQLETTTKNDSQLFQIWYDNYTDYMMSPNARTSQEDYAKGSDIKIQWSECLGATLYYITIWRADAKGKPGTQIYSDSYNKTYSYTMHSVQNGFYHVYVMAVSSTLGSSPWSEWEFTVADNTLSSTPENLGDDFYAVILTWNAWKPIANDYETDSFVRLQTGEHEKNSAHQLWRFQRQSDGTYVIRSVQDGNCLVFHNTQYGVRQENDPVTANEAWDNLARQKWWIYQSSNGGYFFESYHYSSEKWCMTLTDNSTEPEDGTPITMYPLTRMDNQSWGIYAKSEVQLKAPELTVQSSNASNETVFSWDHVFGAKELTVKIWNDQYSETEEPDYTEIVTSTSSGIQLPAGTYEANVTASNFWQSFTSQNVRFTVKPDKLILNSSASIKLDRENNIIYGLHPEFPYGEITAQFANNADDIYVDGSIVTTGCIVYYVDNEHSGDVLETFTAVLYGDVNGDGIYDGADALIVNCLANGLLTREQVGEAVYMAADCNHDGVITADDVTILEQAGVLLANVDQTKLEEELQTDSVYQDYVSLIDQTPDAEDATVEEPADEPAEQSDTGFNILSFLETLVTRLATYIKTLLSILK